MRLTGKKQVSKWKTYYAYEKKEFNYLAKCSYENYSNKEKWSKLKK